MTRHSIFAAAIVLLCCSTARDLHAQASQPELLAAARTVTVVSEGPIYVTTRPSSRLAPLKVATVGMTLKTTGREEGDWVQVQFDDPQWGVRTGWILKTHVRVIESTVPGRDKPAGTGAARTAPSPQPRQGAAGSKPARLEVYLAVGGGYQGGVKRFADAMTFPQYVETARFDADYRRKNGPTIDASGAVRITRTVAVGVGFSSFSKSGSGEVSGEIPHPFFFERMRAGGPFAMSGVTHQERVVRLEAAALVPAGRRTLLMFGVGPAFVSVTQDVVESVQWHEAGYPYDAPVVIEGVTKSKETGSKVGFSGGMDVGFYMSRNVGIGVAVRFVRARVPLNDRIKVDAGGLQAGAGLRLKLGAH